MATEIEAKYRVVTPMFCAGAYPERAELRVPSFKGVLRFWWRALAWPRLNGKLDAIRQEEDRLFGSSSVGQSRISLRLEMTTPPAVTSAGDVLTSSAANEGPVGEGARYLGYGAMEAFASSKRGKRAGELTRACLRAPFDFTIRTRGRCLSDDMIRMLQHALIAVGIFGGMGARSRRGYGSLNMQSLRVNGEEQWAPPHSLNELQDRINTLARHGNQRRPPEFTAFSEGTRHVLVEGGDKAPMGLLDLVGREMVRYRSWGHNGEVLGHESERNFKDDHDLMKRSQRNIHPRRIAFGLPHNYGKEPDRQVGPYSRELDRRASPLFLHVHQCGDTAVAVLSFFPAQFLPDNTAISVGRSTVAQTPEDDLYRPIHAFLDRLLDQRQCREPLTAAEVKS